jgi:UDP-N-acetyl-D-glucosamine dehydrogenase
VIGGGYVGLPLAVEFGKVGFQVTIFDIDESKVLNIKSGKSYIPDVPTEDVRDLVATEKLTASTTFEKLDDMDVVIICVPTPLKKTKDPDIQYIVMACESIADHLHAPMLISLESSTFPGTTDELMLPMFTVKGFEVGKDFFLCFSPERVDPGNKDFHTKNIPKVIGGITPTCTQIGQLFYETAIETVIPVQGTRTAEMVKLLENTFRMINIGMINELAIMCDRMKINIWDVIDAAKTKPFGFMPFYPGIGVGGHCIPIDPFYLSWKSKQYGCDPRFIELAGVINAQMPHYVVQKVQNALNDRGKAIKGSHIHVSGVAYKKDIDDVRESPAVDMIHLLIDKGADLTYYDPYIPNFRVNGYSLTSQNLEWESEGRIYCQYEISDCVVIGADHSCVDYQKLLEKSHLVIDPLNALKRFNSSKIIR